MKSRVKATGEIWEFSQIDEITFKSAINGHLYCAEELEFLEPSAFTPDYWTRLEHQYAGMAMQTMLATLYNSKYCAGVFEPYANVDSKEIARLSIVYAHALVEKMKEKEERK